MRREDCGVCDLIARLAALHARRAPAQRGRQAPLVRQRLLAAAEAVERQPFAPRRSVELIGPQLPIDTDRSPRALVEAAVDGLGLPVSWCARCRRRPGRARPPRCGR